MGGSLHGGVGVSKGVSVGVGVPQGRVRLEGVGVRRRLGGLGLPPMRHPVLLNQAVYVPPMRFQADLKLPLGLHVTK